MQDYLQMCPLSFDREELFRCQHTPGDGGKKGILNRQTFPFLNIIEKLFVDWKSFRLFTHKLKEVLQNLRID